MQTHHLSTPTTGEPVLKAADLDAIRRFDTCEIANAIEEFDVRLRNEGYARPGLRCFSPDLPPVPGYAVTAQIRCANPPPTTHTCPDRTDWWSLIDSLPGGTCCTATATDCFVPAAPLRRESPPRSRGGSTVNSPFPGCAPK